MTAPPSAARELTPLEMLERFRPHDGTFDDFVAARREAQPDRELLVFEGRSWSWQTTENATARLAGHLLALGVGAGDRVAIMARNSPWHVFALLAAARIGAMLVPMNPQFRDEEARYVFGHCTPACVLADAEALPVAIAAFAAAGGMRPAVLLDDTLDAALERTPPHAAPGSGDPDRPCIIVYTSGTTGFPKGAMHSQASMIAAGEAFIERMHLQPDERMLVVLPMFHINAMFYSVAGSLAAGATLVIERKFAASTFWQTVKRERVTQVNIIEAIATILLDRPATEFVPDHGLRRIYGVRQPMMAPIAARFGVPVLIGGYAMTEIPGVLSTPVGGPVRAGSMGRLCRHPDPARPWATCRIVDDAGHDVPIGTAGELLVRTPILMKGYFADAAQTRESFLDGWFRTGDLVRADADGFHYFVSRRKDIIRRRGENIAGAEIDRVVGEHPAVLMAAAVAVPSPLGEDDILLVVKPRDGHTVGEADLVAWCRERLAPMKVPRFVVLVDTMPLTPTHKVAKAVLRGDASLVARAVEFTEPGRSTHDGRR